MSLYRYGITAATVVTVGIAAAGCGSGPRDPSPDTAAPPVSVGAPASPQHTVPAVARVADVFHGGPLFGVMVPNPSRAGIDAITARVGCRPGLVKLFASVDAGISTASLRAVAGVPLLTIEPWESGRGPKQPAWSLAATIGGKWDANYAAIARSVARYRRPVAIRLAHEMNGHWYPWGQANGNRRGQYAAAWRHVVRLFRANGARNALWVWSPNVIRGAESRTIGQYWPGERYVDLVGLTGYGIDERSPDQTYRATLRQLYALTAKPVLLTEVGVRPGRDKRSWLTAFGPWLRRNPRVVGFVWNEVLRDGVWRYDDTPAHLAAFKSSLARGRVRCERAREPK